MTKKTKKNILRWNSQLESGIKNPLWIIFMLLLFFLLFFWGIKTQALTFSIVLSVFIAVYALIHLRSTATVKISLSSKTLTINKQKIPLEQIEKYWFIIQPPMHNYLYVKIKKRLIPPLKINIQGQNPAEIQQKFGKKVPQDQERQLTLSESLTRIFKI